MTRTAVLASGGLDSAVLLVDFARSRSPVTPLFVRSHHAWEAGERAALARFLAAVNDARIAPPRELALPMDDVYGTHWSVSGRDVPGWSAADAAVELPGRNLVLLAKALVLAAQEGWTTVALGTLDANPFP